MRGYTKRKLGVVAAVSWACAVLPPGVRGQDPATTQDSVTDDAEWRRRMEARVQQLEKENRELRGTVGEVRDTQQAVMRDAQSRGWIGFEAGEPRLTTPDFFDVNKYVSEGDFPGSIRIPGTNTSLQLGGY